MIFGGEDEDTCGNRDTWGAAIAASAAVIQAVSDEAEAARQGMLVETIGIYEQLRRAELDALEATQRWADAEVLTLPAKEYYQERRLKSLGLDTEWDETEGNQWTGSRGAAW